MAAEHDGTHLDAPVHFNENGKSVDTLPLQELVGEAAVIVVTEACRQNPDYQISVTDLRSWEETTTRQLADVVVLLRTGYAQHWPDRNKHLGTDQLGPKQLLNCISPDLFRKPLDSLLSIAKSKQLVSTPQVPTVANQHDFKASLPCSNTKSWPLKI